MFNTFLLKFVNSGIFKSFIMTIILINTLTTAFYATFSKHPASYKVELQILEVLDAIFLAIYTVELVLKVWIKPRSFFYNGFNCFDFFVLVLSYSQVMCKLLTLLFMSNAIIWSMKIHVVVFVDDV
jgi:hypothetical protein